MSSVKWRPFRLGLNVLENENKKVLLLIAFAMYKGTMWHKTHRTFVNQAESRFWYYEGK